MKRLTLIPVLLAALVLAFPATGQVTLSGSIQSDILVPEEDEKIGAEQSDDKPKTFQQIMMEEFPVDPLEDEEFAFAISGESESESTTRDLDTVVFGGLKADPDNSSDYIEEDAISDDGTSVDEITEDEQIDNPDKI